MEKLLPCSIDAEMGVLGSIILDPDAITQVVESLQPPDFYREAHRILYETILALYRTHEPPDFITICDALERHSKLDEIGGAGYVTSLVNGVPTSGNIAYYGHIVEQKAVYRRLIHGAGRIAAEAYEQAPDALLKAEEIVYRISQGRKLSHVSTIGDVLARYQDTLDVLHEQPHSRAVPGSPSAASV